MQANGRTMRQGVASSLRGSHARAANAPARAREVRYGGTPLRVRACLLTLHALPRPARVANRVRAAFGPKARATNPDAHANALARQGAPAPVPPLRVYGAAPRATRPLAAAALACRAAARDTSQPAPREAAPSSTRTSSLTWAPSMEWCLTSTARSSTATRSTIRPSRSCSSPPASTVRAREALARAAMLLCGRRHVCAACRS